MNIKKLCLNTDTVLDPLYNIYCKRICTDDTNNTKQASDDLYNAPPNNPLKEKGTIDYLICPICICTNNPLLSVV